MNTTIDLKAIRKQLENRRASLIKQITLEEEKLTLSSSQNPDRSSLAMEYASHERDLALYEQDNEQLLQIDAALGRLDAGTYHICEDCKKPINPERLEALPYATLCIQCQANRERR